MTKPLLDYRPATPGDDPTPHVRWQTIVSCSLLGGPAVRPRRPGVAAARPELISAAISLCIAGVIIYFPYVRT